MWYEKVTEHTSVQIQRLFSLLFTVLVTQLLFSVTEKQVEVLAPVLNRGEMASGSLKGASCWRQAQGEPTMEETAHFLTCWF